MTFTVGDTRPILTGRALSDAAGANLAGATNLTLHIQKADASVLTVSAAPVSAPDGTWSYTWATNDLSVAGTWTVELQVTYSDTGIQTFGPVSFPVANQIA